MDSSDAQVGSCPACGAQTEDAKPEPTSYGICEACGEILVCDSDGRPQIATDLDLLRFSPFYRFHAKRISAYIKARRSS